MINSINLGLKVLGVGFAFAGVVANASPLNGTTCEGKRIRWEEVLRGGGPAPQEGELITQTELKIDGSFVERTELRYLVPPVMGFHNVSFDEASKVQLSVSGNMHFGTEIYEVDVTIKRIDCKEVASGQDSILERVRCQRNWAALP